MTNDTCCRPMPCCSFPHGKKLTLAVALVATVGAIFSIATLSTCKFVTVYKEELTSTGHVRTSQGQYDYFYTFFSGTTGFGLSKFERYELQYPRDYVHDDYHNRISIATKKADTSTCERYTWKGGLFLTTQLDPIHRAARSFGIIAVVFGGLSMIMSWCICCAACDIRFTRGLGVSYGLCAIFQSLAFMFFGSELCRKHHCSLASSAWFAIAALYFWAVASVGSFKIPQFEDTSGAPAHPVTSPHQSRTQVTEIVNPDGTKTVTRDTGDDLEGQTEEDIIQSTSQRTLSRIEWLGCGSRRCGIAVTCFSIAALLVGLGWAVFFAYWSSIDWY